MGGPSWTEYKGKDEQGEEHEHCSLAFRLQNHAVRSLSSCLCDCSHPGVATINLSLLLLWFKYDSTGTRKENQWTCDNYARDTSFIANSLP